MEFIGSPRILHKKEADNVSARQGGSDVAVGGDDGAVYIIRNFEVWCTLTIDYGRSHWPLFVHDVHTYATPCDKFTAIS